MTMKTIVFTSIATGVFTLGAAFFVPAADAQQKSTTSDNLHYDIYQPSERLRTRRDTCMKDEDMKGAYCLKKCEKNYVAVGNGRPPRCRSVEPLAPGVMPSAIRIQSAVQPLPPGGAPPPPNKPLEGSQGSIKP
jgi:hypothetical protein